MIPHPSDAKPKLGLLAYTQKSQCTDTRLCWSKVQCLLQEKRQLMLKRPKLPEAFREGFLKARWGKELRCALSAHGHPWLVGDEVTGWYLRGQQHQPPVVFVLVISMQLTSSTWWGFSINKTYKDMAQNIIYGPWGGTKGTWLFLWLNYHYFVLHDSFPLFLHFLISQIKSTLWWTSLVVQLLRLRASIAGDADSIPGQGIKIPHAAQPKQKNKTKNYSLEFRKGLGG